MLHLRLLMRKTRVLLKLIHLGRSLRIALLLLLLLLVLLVITGIVCGHLLSRSLSCCLTLREGLCNPRRCRRGLTIVT